MELRGPKNSHSGGQARAADARGNRAALHCEVTCCTRQLSFRVTRQPLLHLATTVCQHDNCLPPIHQFRHPQNFAPAQTSRRDPQEASSHHQPALPIYTRRSQASRAHFGNKHSPSSPCHLHTFSKEPRKLATNYKDANTQHRHTTPRKN